jgi:hypothetical protein
VDCGQLREHLSAGRIEQRHALAVANELHLGCAF